MNSQTVVNASLRTKQPEANPLNRYLPSESPRSVLQSHQPNKPNLASEVSFDPVTSLRAENGNVYVRAVKNTASRAVSPQVVGGNGQISIRGEHVIELGRNLHEQIRAKVNSQPNYQPQVLTPKHPAAAPVAPRPTQSVVPTRPNPAEAKQRSQDLRTQLEQINQELFRQMKQKIADELARQKSPGKVVPQAQTALKPRIKPQETLNVSQPLPKLAPIQVKQPVSVAPAPIKTASQPQTQAAATLVQPKPVPAAATQTAVVAKLPAKNPPLEPKQEEFPVHINKLEAEIEALTREIAHLDHAFATIETERNQSSLAALSAQLDYDQKVMDAVGQWRTSLTDLVNSHTLALKYLKQKSDWLEDKVESLEGHRARHEKLHRKPKELEIKFTKVAETELPNKPVLAELKPSPISPTATTQGSTQSWNTVASTAVAANPVVSTPAASLPLTLKPDLTKPVENTAETQKPTFAISASLSDSKPSTQASASVPAVPVSIEQATLKAEPSTLDTAINNRLPIVPVAVVEKQVEVEKPISAPNQELIKKLVAEELAKTKLNLQSGQTQSQSSPTTEVAANVSIGQPKALEGNPQAQINVTAIPVSVSDKPKENLPSVATAAAVSSQSDIERQILEAAAKEEVAKEAVIKAKEEAAEKARAERERAAEAAKKPPTPAATQETAPQSAGTISSQNLAAELTTAKVSLSKVEPSQLKPEERSALMQKLQNLENQSHITRQFDEIKASSERRKINQELQALLSRLEHGQQQPQTNPTVVKPAEQPIQPQVEALKEQQRFQKSPEEKARIIAEIKGLERVREAQKLEERSRPVVKAQPAYGKMLPNTPTIPNVINGIVKDNRGLLLDTTVIIIKDNNGDPVRAFKTNKIGQFALSTPVPNGVYTLELEKEGYDFDIIEIDVNGGILPPIEIKAR